MDDKKTVAEYAAEIERVQGNKLYSLKQIAKLTDKALSHDMKDVNTEQLIKLLQFHVDRLEEIREEIVKLNWNCLVDNDESFKHSKID